MSHIEKGIWWWRKEKRKRKLKVRCHLSFDWEFWMRGKEFSLEGECIPLLHFLFFVQDWTNLKWKIHILANVSVLPRLPLSEILKLNCYIHYKGRVSVKIIRFSDLCLYFVKEYFKFISHYISMEGWRYL